MGAFKTFIYFYILFESGGHYLSNWLACFRQPPINFTWIGLHWNDDLEHDFPFQGHKCSRCWVTTRSSCQFRSLWKIIQDSKGDHFSSYTFKFEVGNRSLNKKNLHPHDLLIFIIALKHQLISQTFQQFSTETYNCSSFVHGHL